MKKILIIILLLLSSCYNISKLETQEFETQEFEIQEPVTQEFETQEFEIQKPVTQEPVTQEPVTQEFEIQEPVTQEPESQCHPSYSGCLKKNAGDYDCSGGSGNWPNYTWTVRVIGYDEFDLDRDNDGLGCE